MTRGLLDKVGVIVNTESGGSGESIPEEIETILGSGGVADLKVWAVKGEDLDGALREAGRDRTSLIVFGGDGTIGSVARQTAADGPALLPLPGGTLNMLPRALYGDMKWQEVLAATLTDPSERTVSGGAIGKERFFIASVMGAPARWAEAREALRKGEVRTAAEKGKEAFDAMFESEVRYEIGSIRTGTAEAVAVLCPLISKELDDRDTAFEAAVIHLDTVGDVARIATVSAFGEWRESAKIETVTTDSVRVFSGKKIPLILDGEPAMTESPAEVRFIERAFRALVPRGTRLQD